MYPEIHLFGASVQSYIAMLFVAGLVCHWLGPIAAERLADIPRWKVRAVLVWLGVAAIVGGRLHVVANFWGVTTVRDGAFEMLRFWNGIHAGGALLGLSIALPCLLRLYRIPAAKFADSIVPIIALAIAVARLGCFLNGCCFGAVCHGPWCIQFPAGSPPYRFHIAAGLIPPTATASAPVHPLELYFALAGILSAVIGKIVERKKAYPGQSAVVTIVTYAVLAAIAESARANYYPAQYNWRGTLQFTWIALGFAICAVALLATCEVRHRRRLVWSAARS